MKKFCSRCGSEFETAKNDALCLACQHPVKETEPGTGPKNLPASGPGERKKVLIIDDDPDMVDVIAKMLESAACEILKAYDGKGGFQKIVSEKPDLVLCDVLLPQWTGYEILKAVKSQSGPVARTPMIMITSKSSMKDFFSESGIHRFWDKTSGKDLLLAHVREMLNRPKADS